MPPDTPALCGSGNCDQARLAVTDHAMVPSRRVVPARAPRARCRRGAPSCGIAACCACPAWIAPGRTHRPDRHQGHPSSRRHQRAGRHRHPTSAPGRPQRTSGYASSPSCRSGPRRLQQRPGSSMLPSAPASITMGPRTSSPSRSHVTAGTASTTPIPFQELNQLAGTFQREDPLVYCGAVLARHMTSTAPRRPRRLRPPGSLEIPLVPRPVRRAAPHPQASVPAPAIRAAREHTPASSTGRRRRAKPAAASSAPSRAIRQPKPSN